MYEQGQGVTQDYVLAVKWFRKAAEQGEVLAQSILGNKYEIGHGVTQDFVEAAKWYGRAAEQGDKFAQTRLAEIHLRQAPPIIPEPHVRTDAGSGRAVETTPQKHLSSWKRALGPAGNGFGIGVVAGIAAATSVHMSVPPFNKLLFDGLMGVFSGLLFAVPTYLVAVCYYAEKGKR